MVAVTALLTFGGGTAFADGSTAEKLPLPARIGCGDSGVVGAGFTVYVCSSGAGGTKYAHWPELLVVRTDGSYKGYVNRFSQADIVRKSPGGEVIASHNNAVVRVTETSLKTLVSKRRLELMAGRPRIGYINALSVDSAGNIFLLANYWAGNRRGCENIRWELTAAEHLKLIWWSKTGVICG